MYFNEYYNCDTVNGEGVRCSLFVSGCNMHCDGCFNKETWKYNSGKIFTQEFEDKVIEDLKNPYISGLSLLGGNPTDKRNLSSVIKLCSRVKKEIPEKTIWIWSGHIFENLVDNLNQKQLLYLCDVLVDGRFIKELHSKNLKWKGSSNQRVIDLKKSLDTGIIVLYDE